MDDRTRAILVVLATVGLFLTVQLGALSLVPVSDGVDRDHAVTEDPDDPTNSLAYVGVILVATAGMLLLIKLGAEGVIRGIVLLTSGLLSWYVLDVVLAKALGAVADPATLSWLALGGGGAVVLALVVHPEWYVIDAAGVLMGAGAAWLFGINFGLLPALVLLVVLAVYDAISVYGTEHMLTLAEGVMDLNVPVLLVVPTTLSFSMRDPAPAGNGGSGGDGDGSSGGDDATATVPPADDGETEQAAPDGAPEETFARDALFVGLGDAVIPTILVVSGGFFLRSQAPTLVPGTALNLPALGGIVGTTAGLLGLLYLVLEGRAHAGLPLLNGGAIAGYLVGAVVAGIPLTVALGL